MIQKKPVIYQQIAGQRVAVVGSYKSLDDERVAFQLGDYDKRLALVIDPVLEYSTFLGGNDFDTGTSIAVDPDGNAYVMGRTVDGATDFPVTTGAFDEIHNGSSDVFVSKLNPAGDDLVYATFLGGRSSDIGISIAVDADGNAYVTGATQDGATDFPTTIGAFNEIHNGGLDVFVSKLNAAGSGLVYSTFLGGSGFNQSSGIAVDPDGNAYVTGVTDDGTFPTTAGAFDESHNGSADGFVSKLNAAGSGLVYSTFLGGSGFDQSRGIAVDAAGNTYVAGTTDDGTFPTTPGAFDESYNGSSDVFVSKLNAAGSGLVYSTFLGGSSLDLGSGIEVDADGNAYVMGVTDDGTIDYPTTPGAFNETHNGNDDVFVSKIAAPIAVTETQWISVDSSSDDAEEEVLNGNMDLTSSDLELTRESSTQLIGIRFNGLTIPPGSTIVNAYIQFTVDETRSENTMLTLQAEATANAATFGNLDFNISNRMPTTTQVEWTVLPWNIKGAAGFDQATPDLSAILQEVIDGCCWTLGNSVAFIITGSGKRVAESFDGTAPPMLHIEFSTMPPVPQAPDAVNDGTDVAPAYSTGFEQLLTVPDGAEDIVERNDDVGYPAAVVTGFGPGGSYPAGQQGYSREDGDLTIYADGSFSYTPDVGFFGVDYFDYVLENGGGEDIARVYIEVLNQTPLWIPVDRSSDDAEEASNGNMDLTSSDLELPRESSNQQVGIRFNGLSIPQGATILEAYIQFQADETDSEATMLMLKAEDTGNAETFNNSVIDFDISNRMPTTAQVQWNVPEWNSVGVAGPEQATPDLSAIVQEIVNRGDWVPDNSIAFIITGSGKRVAESFNGTAPPMLHLIYSNELPVNQAPDAVDDGTPTDPAYSTSVGLELSVPNGAEDIVERNDDVGFLAAQVVSFGATGVEFLAGQLGQSIDGGDLTVNADGSFSYTPSIDFGVDSFHYVLKNDEGQDTARVFIEILNEIPLWISVDRSSDDAEEQVSNGHMDLTSSDLELIRESSDQLIGIRFNGLTIPQGANIIEAYIQFQVDETGSEPTVLNLQAEDIGNAMTFSNTGFNISDRTPTTAQMQWDVPAWNTIGVAGIDQATPNLAAIVQEVVGRGDWASGNSMAYIITGSGRRVAESFSGTAPPTLHVTYSNVPLP